MGVDYYSRAIIGVKVDSVTVRGQARVCSHPERQGNFCPECGKRMWETVTELHPLLENLESSGFTYCVDTDSQHYFIGKHLARSRSSRSDGECGMIVLPDTLDLNSLKGDLKKYLGDLYRELDFGLWTVLYCSY